MDFFQPSEFFAALRRQVVPDLRTWPWPEVWVCGRGAGLMAYAAAIVLREAGLLERARLLVTLADEDGLATARAGVLRGAPGPADAAEAVAERAYLAAGGVARVAEYARFPGDGTIRMRPLLAERMSFFQHDPAGGGSPNEFHLILSGEPRAATEADAAARLLSVMHASLARYGVLGLCGSGASLDAHPRRSWYLPLGGAPGLWRRVR